MFALCLQRCVIFIDNGVGITWIDQGKDSCLTQACHIMNGISGQLMLSPADSGRDDLRCC